MAHGNYHEGRKIRHEILRCGGDDDGREAHVARQAPHQDDAVENASTCVDTRHDPLFTHSEEATRERGENRTQKDECVGPVEESLRGDPDSRGVPHMSHERMHDGEQDGGEQECQPDPRQCPDGTDSRGNLVVTTDASHRAISHHHPTEVGVEL